ncbi:uncharacterized protein LOC111712382 [Eurytemora carolleeae]|uniref:uncharacterized protein LOC111712382 n=1 Tax=Eurytemora carolleeae TaxID=1294199 RepID=UPI000C792449|nr:uncharacterized protein LOC111712382 [Eurytemora carolleeae]|eukprot:XP_023342736.1 uncharacterized protein LOC111712382 [Eurytemora affinis]
MNFKIYSSIPTSTLVTSRRRRALNFRLARISVALVIIFLVFNTPRLTIGLYEVTKLESIIDCFSNKQRYYPSTVQLVGDICSQYCAVLNSSVNFCAYCMLGSQFQSELRNLIYSLCGRTSQAPQITVVQEMVMQTSKPVVSLITPAQAALYMETSKPLVPLITPTQAALYMETEL